LDFLKSHPNKQAMHLVCISKVTNTKDGIASVIIRILAYDFHLLNGFSDQISSPRDEDRRVEMADYGICRVGKNMCKDHIYHKSVRVACNTVERDHRGGPYGNV